MKREEHERSNCWEVNPGQLVMTTSCSATELRTTATTCTECRYKLIALGKSVGRFTCMFAPYRLTSEVTWKYYIG